MPFDIIPYRDNRTKRVRVAIKDDNGVVGRGEGATMADALRDLADFIERHSDDFGTWQQTKRGAK